MASIREGAGALGEPTEPPVGDEEVREALDERFRLKAMPAVKVKGKETPMVTYFVEGTLEG